MYKAMQLLLTVMCCTEHGKQAGSMGAVSAAAHGAMLDFTNQMMSFEGMNEVRTISMRSFTTCARSGLDTSKLPIIVWVFGSEYRVIACLKSRCRSIEQGTICQKAKHRCA